MNKEKLKGYANLLEATSRDTARLVSEYVSEQSLVWQKLAKEMFKLWKEDGGKFLFSQKMLLPVSASKDSGYLFINLRTGLLASDKVEKIIEFASQPDLLDAEVVMKSLIEIHSSKPQWGEVNHKFSTTSADEKIINDISRWMLITRVKNFGPLRPSQCIPQIIEVLANLGLQQQDISKNIKGLIWSMCDRGTLIYTPDRKISL